MVDADKKVLTIGIPTYNRAAYLDKCLAKIVAQIDEYKDLIAIHVSDNASVDNTEEIIEKYIAIGLDVDYTKHKENLGMDGNFYSLYQRCSTKYIWMLSDDDFILPTALKKIMLILSKQEFGVLYLNGLWFNNDSDISNEVDDSFIYKRYDVAIEFINRVNYWVTFISGNIVNKHAVQNVVNPLKFDKTYLIQLGWIIPAIFQDLPNYVIENNIIACKAENTGGYKLFKVFGENFNFILDNLIREGYDKRMKDIMNNYLITNFFPAFLVSNNPNFSKEKYLSSFVSLFWKYKNFWKIVFPILIKYKLKIK